jgi:hypothetical protein
MKLPIPTSKLQRSFNIQAPNRVRWLFEVWGLGLLWKLEPGVWIFTGPAVRSFL